MEQVEFTLPENFTQVLEEIGKDLLHTGCMVLLAVD